MKPRVAMIALTADPGGGDEPYFEVNERVVAEVTERLTALGIELKLPVPTAAARLVGVRCMNGEDTRQMVREAQAWDADCVLMLVTGFHTSGLISAAARELRVPLILWAVPTETWSLVGGSLNRGALVDLGVEHLWLYGEVSGKAAVRANDYARAAMVKARLNNTTYGLVGGRAYDMTCTTFDYTQIQNQFGVFTHHVDQIEMYLRAQGLAADRVAQTRARITEGKVVEVPEQVLDHSLRSYLALRDMVDEYRWDFVGVKCQPEMINNYCGVCLAIAQLNDDGIPTACECDTSGVLTSYMLSLLADEPAYLGDTADLSYDTQILTLANCGAMAMRLARPDEPVQLTEQYTSMGPATGVCTTYQCRAGNITLARLNRAKDKYLMTITPAEVVNRPESERSKRKERWPHAFVKLPGNAEALVEHMLGNHFNFAYGDHAAPLVQACSFLDITPLCI